ncbi:MAG: hypothetical protein H7Z37_03350 [Pyrinomonadaceae bacterium]|nr:hypothetical protein [Pyrinomonadaceae bacterium]
MVNENLISTLEQSLRQMRQARTQKVSRLREIETEAENLRSEIDALDGSSSQIETTIHSLLFTSHQNQGNRKNNYNEARETRDNQDNRDNRRNEDYDSHDYKPKTASNSNSYNSRQSSVVQMPRGGSNNNNSSGGMRHEIPTVEYDVEILSERFVDRTITQATTMLLREAGKPLHVNELYNRLRENGFPFTGNNPTISIAVSLNRNRRFRKVAPGTFDLVIRDASQAAS